MYSWATAEAIDFNAHEKHTTHVFRKLATQHFSIKPPCKQGALWSGFTSSSELTILSSSRAPFLQPCSWRRSCLTNWFKGAPNKSRRQFRGSNSVPMPEEVTVHSRHFLLTAAFSVNDVITATYSTMAGPRTARAGNEMSRLMQDIRDLTYVISLTRWLSNDGFLHRDLRGC